MAVLGSHDNRVTPVDLSFVPESDCRRGLVMIGPLMWARTDPLSVGNLSAVTPTRLFYIKRVDVPLSQGYAVLRPTRLVGLSVIVVSSAPRAFVKCVHSLVRPYRA